MEKQPLLTTVLKAPRSLKDARYIAQTLAIQIDLEYTSAKPGRKNITKFVEFDGGFSLCIPLKVDGVWKNCPIYRWSKSDIGAKLEYDPRVISL